MSGRRAMGAKLKLPILLFLLLLIASCASPSRYRMLIANKAGQPLVCSGYFYSRPDEIANMSFDEMFAAGKQANLRNGEWIQIGRPTIVKYNYFWVGIKSDSGERWVLNGEFEAYNRYWLDISEGLRIDYTIEPNGIIHKNYWQ